MKKIGKTFIVILILFLMIAAGVFFAYKKGYIGKDDTLTEENNIKNSNIEITKKDENKDVNKSENKDEKKITNAELMDEYKKLLNGQDSYAIVDFNEDDIPDFITYKEEASSDKIVSNYTVYSYIAGKVTEIGKILGRKDNNLLYKMNDKTILSVYGYMGHEVVKTYALEDDKLVEKTSADRDVKVGEVYTVGDMYIPFDFVSDTIQFEMYK